MASSFKDKPSGAALTINAKWVSWAHTIVAYAAFVSAFFVGVSLHYNKIVQNEWFGYPDEWFPSVSATIGDRYPERSFFMIFIAITSGPRFTLVGLWYLLTNKPGRVLPKVVAIVGIFRTLTCGGWTYITSTDDHDMHDIFMISYLVATIPWTFGCLALSPPNAKAIKYRKYIATAFFGTIIPLVWCFIRHKVYRIPGAYTTYAFFEWSLILYDVAFDAVTALDFATFEIVIRDVGGLSQGHRRGKSRASIQELEREKVKATAGLLEARFSWAELFDTAAEVYHGFVFWSMLTSLGLLIWYFPLWYMGISGYEIFVMAPVSPTLLAIPSVRNWVLKNQRICHLSSLVGLLAWLVEMPELRLFVVGVAVFMSCLSWAATFYSENIHGVRLESKILAWLVGLTLSSAAKFAWWTNNPIWPIMKSSIGGQNVIGLLLAIWAALRFTEKTPLNTGSNIDAKQGGSSYLGALGIAGLFFGLHSLLSDTSTMILWGWSGFPVTGPVSNVHGWLTGVAMTAGVLTGIARPRLASAWAVYGVGCVGAALVTLKSDWVGYSGALAIAFYLMAIAPAMLTAAAKKNPAVTFGVGFLLYNFLVLAHVWVVAYAFVPGGPIMREHTDYIMIAMMLCIGAGVFNLTSVAKPRYNLDDPYTKPQRSQHRKYHTIALGLVNLFFIVSTYFRFPTYDYKPYHEDEHLITTGIWCIHFYLDNDMYAAETRMRDLLKELEVDVFGLLESDTERIIMGNRDMSQFLAEDLGMYVDYGPGPNKHTWGAVLLSKFPIVNSTHHLLPSPVGELAPAIHATIDAYGELVDVFVFHSGQEEDPEDRRLQSEYLTKLMGSTDRPSILLSYLVTKPLEGNYNTYVSDTSGMHDVDPSDWDRWCEYILYKHIQRVGYARVSRSTITDTELQTAKFVVPTTKEKKDVVKVMDTDEPMRDHRVSEDKVPEGWRYPAMFRGEGKRGHFYHVFDEPRYYLPGSVSEFPSESE